MNVGVGFVYQYEPLLPVFNFPNGSYCQYVQTYG